MVSSEICQYGGQRTRGCVLTLGQRCPVTVEVPDGAVQGFMLWGGMGLEQIREYGK
jgi:hypothetical protein